MDRFGPFTVDDRPGEQWIRLKRKFGENEDINIEATMFDGAIPASKTAGGLGEDVELHISFVVNITKDKGSNVLEIVCSAWPDSIEINKLFVRGCQRMPSGLYTGPGFKYVDFFLLILFTSKLQILYGRRRNFANAVICWLE